MITIVSGLGRCGSSLLMQMLQAGGMDNTGYRNCVPPFYEDPRGAGKIKNAKEWLPEYEDRAVKILNPHNSRLPQGLPLRIIWLDRDHKQQARSMAKFMVATGKREHISAMQIKRAAKQLNKKRAKGLAHLRQVAKKLMFMKFEEILENPKREARRIADFIDDVNLDVRAMVAVVRPRGPECLPHMMEEQIARQHMTGGPNVGQGPGAMQVRFRKSGEESSGGAA